MSIILRHPITKERVLFCKGADSAIFPRLRKHRKSSLSSSEAAAAAETEARTRSQLESYAKMGLRVLVMAKKVLDDDAEYEDWVAEHAIAENALHKRDRLLFESYNRYYTTWILFLSGQPKALARPQKSQKKS